MLRQLTVLVSVFLVFASTVFAEHEPALTVEVPMRDGTNLMMDLYIPRNDAGELQKGLPCLLARSPGGRQGPHREEMASLSDHGYIVAIQDTRSALDEQGKTLPYLHDGWDGEHRDGHDTIKWLASSEWSNGKIGSLGTSANGITQLLMAPSAPSELCCQYVNNAAGSLYHHAIFHGGQFQKAQVEGWLGYYAKDPSVKAFVLEQPEFNDFWKQFDTVSAAHLTTAPAVHVGGWYDLFLRGTIETFCARQDGGGEGARHKQKLVIGPWTHFWPAEQRMGDFEVPEAARQLPAGMSQKDWFDYHLKGIDNGVHELPPVTYFVMGPFDGSPSSGNVWKTAESWPVPSTPTTMYLRGEGTLSPLPPEQQGPEAANLSLSFHHDPSDSTPTIGGKNLFLESGPKDQRSIEQREDVLIFTSDALSDDLEVTGRVFAKLWVDSDVDDTDFAVRLCDVYPDGRSILITDGLTRVRRAAGQSDDNNVGESEGLREIEVDLWSTSMVFAKGHQIRVSVSGANYPCYERNLHGGKDPDQSVAAKNRVYADAEHRSQLILPVVPRA